MSLLAPLSLLLLIVTVLLSVQVGPMNISLIETINALLPSFTSSSADGSLPSELIIQQIRLPRTLLAVSVGAILALCGTVMQGLFRNPLADPGIIGVSAGAALGAAFAIVMFGSLAQDYPQLLLLGTLPLFSFLGGATTTFVVYRIGTGPTGTSVAMMLLAGVAISALASSGLGLMNYFADDKALRDLSLWTLGSLAGASWSGIGLIYATWFVLFWFFYRDADRLNALLLGEPEAKHLGIQVQSLKRRLILLTAAGVGVTVSLAGMIGFVGLLVPHLCRMLVGPNHRHLLPISMIGGALLMLMADILARTVIAPLDMPVGIVTALIGSPFFIWLLTRQRGRML